MLILISDAFDSSLSEKLSRLGEVTDDKSRLKDAEVVLVRSATKCTKEYLDSAPNLKLIIRGGVGTDNIDKPYAAEKGITVRNTPRASAIAVAELAFALMLSATANIVPGHNSMKEGKWEKKKLKRSELYGKNLCLVGAGNIGTEVARRAMAFGMKIVACDTKFCRIFDPAFDYGNVTTHLMDALPDADYISLHLPLTNDTRGMINKDLISSMKDGAILINTGRGATVEAQDVADALESGKIRAYCCDVWPSDPPAEDYPLLKAPNVLMTPHIGANTKENLLRIGSEVEQIIKEYQGGKK